jgi:hypothetical protein
LLPIIVLAVTQLGGLTHLFQQQQQPESSPLSIAGVWEDNVGGTVTFEHGALNAKQPILVTGSWRSGANHGSFSRGSYDPTSRLVNVDFHDQSAGQFGMATFTLDPTGRQMVGTYRYPQGGEGGPWTLSRRGASTASQAATTTTQPQSVNLATWGTFVDPRGECSQMRTGDIVSIRVPGTRPYNLLPTAGYNLDSPRVVQELEGDFLIQTTVMPYERPKPNTATRPARPVSFRAAGLLVWVNEQKFLRFERASYGEAASGAPYLNMEWYVGGQPGNTDVQGPPILPDAPTHLQIERRGQVLYLRRSEDGRTWTQSKAVSTMELPQRVSVGVVASNSTNTELTASFENLRLRGTPTPPAEFGWVQLFNGHDMQGWKTHPNKTDGWQVEGNELVGRGEGSYLFSERSDYEDFHFRIEAQINGAANGGQYCRTSFALPDQLGGYEADVATFSDAFTGSLYYVDGNGKPAKVPASELLGKADQWFTQEIIARGNQIVILVNGTKVVDHVDATSAYRRGHLALQALGANAVIRFRKIEIKELPPTAPP